MRRNLLAFTDVQRNYLRAVIRRDQEFFAAEDENYFYISEGHYAVRIPLEVCGVRVHKDHFKMSPLGFNNMLTPNADLVQIFFTGASNVNNGVHVYKFESAEEYSFNVYLAENIVKIFTKEDGFTFWSTGENKAAYVKLYDSIYGIICPVNMDGGAKK